MGRHRIAITVSIAFIALMVGGVLAVLVLVGTGPSALAPYMAQAVRPNAPADPSRKALSMGDIEGVWAVTITGKRAIAVALTRRPDGAFRLAGDRASVFDRDYRAQGDSLVMVASPDSYRNVVWHRAAGYPVNGPAFELLNTAYAGATMARPNRE